MGGLATAALLARLHGRKVLVLERHYRAGGFTHTFSRRGGFEWDVGVHYVGEMGAPGMMRNAMQVATGGEVHWARMPETYDRLVFPGFEFGVRAGKENFRADLHAAFPAEGRAIDRFFHDVDRAASWMTVLGMRSSAPAPVAAIMGAVMAGRGALARRTTRSWLDEHVRDERLKAVLGARWGDYGLPPSRSAFLAHAVITSHYLEGGYYPSGTSARIAEGATRVIEAAGGAVRVRAEVERILVEGGRAVGVRLAGGETLRAPVVVSDAGARATFLRLVPDDVPLPFRDELRAIPRSMSHVSLYLGLSRSAASLGVKGENFWLHDELDHDRMWDRGGELLSRPGAPDLRLLPVHEGPGGEGPHRRDHRRRGREPLRALGRDPVDEARRGVRGHEGADRRHPAGRGGAAAAGALRGWSCTGSSRPRSPPPTSPATPAGRSTDSRPPRIASPKPWLRSRTPVKGLYLAGADALMLGIGGAVMSGVMCTAAIAGTSTFGQLTAAARRLPDPTAIAATPSVTSPSIA